MFPCQRLNGFQIVSVSVGTQSGLLLLNPRDRFVGRPVEHVNLFSARQRVLSRVRQFLEILPLLFGFFDFPNNPSLFGIVTFYQFLARIEYRGNSILARR